MPGLAPQNIRQQPPEATPANDAEIIVQIDEDGGDQPEIDERGNILKIEHGDGAVTVSLDGSPLGNVNGEEPTGWFDNLVHKIDQAELSRIADDLLRGISDDEESRKDWTETIATGIQLLGLKVEVPGLQGASDGAPVEGMSKVRHPLLLEAVLRFQANARSELLPTDGPVKVRGDTPGSTVGEDRLADALEEDLNHYLTVRAPEYYPDTDRMLFKLGVVGIAFKKVYFCPLRMRPVSETVDAADLIVNNSATDLTNAKRVTHKVMMKPSTVRRLQILKVYSDVPLETPAATDLDAVQRAQKDQQGIAAEATNPEDRDREIYECYCELDIKGYEHTLKGKETGLEIPYRVTIDKTSRQILAIVRDYDEAQGLPEPRKTFVPYIFVPGFGFYAIGLLHILGNTTNAITAAWREMLDNGMYANFPGFLIAKQGTRQNTNIFRVPPGGGQQVDTQGMPIQQAVMPLPYQTTGMAPLMQLVGNMEETGQRIGGTSELQVGEGRADAPVGTTLAMIEQATKVLNSVHKRMHAAQAEEFGLLVQCFREHPESFLGKPTPSGMEWTEETFINALNDCDLVPQADPNTASHSQRVMKIMGLKQLQAANPSLYDPIAIDTAALQAMGWSNPEQFFVPPSAMGQPPPELQEAQVGMKVALQAADAKTKEANAKVAEVQAKMEENKLKAMQQGGLGAGGMDGNQVDTPVDRMEAQIKAQDAQTKREALAIKREEIAADERNQQLDREAEAHSDAIDLAKTIMGHQADAELAARQTPKIEKEIEGG